MKTKTCTVYSFSELSADAKQRAKDEHAEANGFVWAKDYLRSLKALAEHFGGKLTNWQIDWFGCSYSTADFKMPDDTETDAASIASKLAELGAFDPATLRGRGDCKLTGFCADEAAIDGFRIAWHAGERELNELMRAAFHEWLENAHTDCAGQYEDEVFAEVCEVNGYQFTEDGTLD